MASTGPAASVRHSCRRSVNRVDAITRPLRCTLGRYRAIPLIQFRGSKMMRLRFIAVICLLFWSARYPGSAALAGDGVKVEKDIQYVPGGDKAQSLDLYLPERASDKPLPLVVWIHGGGWSAGSKADCPAKGM